MAEWAFTSIIAGDAAVVAGLLTPEEVANDPSVCRNQTYLGYETLRQAYLPIGENGLGLTSSDAIKGTAYIGNQDTVRTRSCSLCSRESATYSGTDPEAPYAFGAP